MEVTNLPYCRYFANEENLSYGSIAYIDNKKSFVYDMRCRPSLDANTVETNAGSEVHEHSPCLGSEADNLLAIWRPMRWRQIFRQSSHGRLNPHQPP